MDSTTDQKPHRVRIESITPAPTDAVREAIQIALDQAWPEPEQPWSVRDEEIRWRFGSRPWRSRSIPVQRWGR